MVSTQLRDLEAAGMRGVEALGGSSHSSRDSKEQRGWDRVERMYMKFYCYMLLCRGGKYYVGHTEDLTERMSQHEAGLGGRFTSKHLPVVLVWHQEFADRRQAKSCEAALKKWSRAKKEALIAGNYEAIQHLAKPLGS